MILVTRPDPAGSELCHVLQNEGYATVLLPTIDFVSPPDMAAMAAGIQSIGEQDWLIFISPQAVIATVPAMRRVWPTMPPTVKFAAVGMGTANALKQAGYHAVFPAKEWSSEGLLAMPEFNDVANKKIAVIRGVGGRELLEPVLSERQAQVRPIITYERKLPDNASYIKKYVDIFKRKEVGAVVCTSASSVANFKKLFEHEAWQEIASVPVVVISERIKKLANELGFQTIWVAENASHQAIAERIKDYVR